MTANILYSVGGLIIAHDSNILYKDDTLVVLWISQIDDMHDYLVGTVRVRLNGGTFYVRKLYFGVRGIDIPRLQNTCRSRFDGGLKALRWALEIDLVPPVIDVCHVTVFVLEFLNERKMDGGIYKFILCPN